MGWALVRVKPGARYYMDMRLWEWGEDDRVFVGQKLAEGQWDCKTPGYGVIGKVPEHRMPRHHKKYLSAYGNGGIMVYRQGVELLTPILGYEPDYPEESWDIWRKENTIAPPDLCEPPKRPMINIRPRD